MEHTATKGNDFWHINWGDSYKLSEIAKTNGFINDLPCKEEFISFENLLNKDNILILSELSAGRMVFIDRYIEYLDKNAISWLSVKANIWEKSTFIMSENNKPSESFSDAVSDLKKVQGVGAKVEVLRNGLQKESKRIVLILRNISGFDKENVQEIIMALRQLCEAGYTKNKLSILIMDTLDPVFMDAAEESNYVALCYQYRLPILDSDEIISIAKKMKLQFEYETSDRVLRYTGGQPLLVQDLLRRLQNNKIAIITDMEIDKVAKQMRSNPHAVTKKWQEELKNILINNPELIHPLKAYVSGHSLSERFPPPEQERSLFITGWLRVNYSKRWGISSELHASLARSVLYELVGE